MKYKCARCRGTGKIRVVSTAYNLPDKVCPMCKGEGCIDVDPLIWNSFWEIK